MHPLCTTITVRHTTQWKQMQFTRHVNLVSQCKIQTVKTLNHRDWRCAISPNASRQSERLHLAKTPIAWETQNTAKPHDKQPIASLLPHSRPIPGLTLLVYIDIYIYMYMYIYTLVWTYNVRTLRAAWPPLPRAQSDQVAPSIIFYLSS
jgi:hypothetical protein